MNWAGTDAEDRVPAPGQGFATRNGLLNDVRSRLRTHTGFAIATLNLDHAVKLRSMPEFRRAYHEHTHVTADGNPIVWMERLAGQDVELVPGSDLILPLSRLAAETHRSVALVGTTETALEGAERMLREIIPGVCVSLRWSPSQAFDPASDEAACVVTAVRKSGAGLCFVALGAPKQELFAARLHREVPSLGIISVGAGLDFLAGTQKRAPKLVRALALEWVWRLCGDPVRLTGRYARCMAVVPGMTWRAMRTRRPHRAGATG